MTNAEIYERIDRLESRLAENLNAIKWDLNVLLDRFPEHEGLREAAEEFLDEND